VTAFLAFTVVHVVNEKSQFVSGHSMANIDSIYENSYSPCVI